MLEGSGDMTGGNACDDMQINMLSRLQLKGDMPVDLLEYATPDGASHFSKRVTDRLAAMYRMADCSLVSSDGTSYPVHETKLLEQSKVLRRVHTYDWHAIALVLYQSPCSIYRFTNTCQGANVAMQELAVRCGSKCSAATR